MTNIRLMGGPLDGELRTVPDDQALLVFETPMMTLADVMRYTQIDAAGFASTDPAQTRRYAYQRSKSEPGRFVYVGERTT